MPLRYKRRLLEHLKHRNYTPSTLQTLTADLGIEDEVDFADAVQALAGEGVVEISEKGLVALPSLASLKGPVEGRFQKAAKGFGFVRPELATREGEVFIPPGDTLDALTGDIVKVVVRRDTRRERRMPEEGPAFVGEIVEVVQRRRGRFSGEVDRRGGKWLVYPDGKLLRDPIIVRDAESRHVKPGDKVVVEIVEYPQGGAYNATLAEGVIVKVLGEAGRPDVETQAIIAAYSLPGDFPEQCLDQARAITRAFEKKLELFERQGASALPDREDLTGQFIITIDPPDAKDYDDAISIKKTGDGWELGVHIADVGEFIEAGTPLDEESSERGTSVYLPRLVIPMLPEILSNGICSLQEGVVRFCKSTFMKYDEQGRVRGERVSSTIIRSAKRMTYLEAQALIDGNKQEAGKHAKTETEYTDGLIRALREMDALAKAIRGRRQRQGMISLELPEAELVFDEEGRVIDAVPEDDAFTHTLIEMFMVEANEALARLFERLDVPLLRRIHPEPTPHDVDEMRQVARVAGFNIPKNPSREELQALLDATRGTPAARAVHMAVLRTLTKAEYSPAPIGHFALASDAYAHFTSPIRRYPDLTVHRALLAFLRATDNGRNAPKGGEKQWQALGRKLRDSQLCPSEEELTRIGRNCSQREQNAEDAERELRQFLVLQLLEQHIGENFPGVITGVMPRGVFVQLDKYLADGMIKKEDLPGDVTRSNKPPSWRMDERTGALVDAASGRSFAMGDRVTVCIAAVDLARRQMDLTIADPASRAGGKAKLKLGGADLEGGIGGGHGAGFEKAKVPGAQRRSRKSKARDKHKPDHRKDRKGR